MRFHAYAYAYAHAYAHAYPHAPYRSRPSSYPPRNPPQLQLHAALDPALRLFYPRTLFPLPSPDLLQRTSTPTQHNTTPPPAYDETNTQAQAPRAASPSGRKSSPAT